jgi:hypothetical protein
MSNWFKKSQEVSSKYRAMVIADIVVPVDMDKEQEKQIATELLSKRLSMIEGDASMDLPHPTFTNSSINFIVESVNEYDKLV